MYVALFLADPLYEGEHMTLIWGGELLATEYVEEVVEALNRDLRSYPGPHATITGHSYFGDNAETLVALVDPVHAIRTARLRLEGYDRSMWDWVPHITGKRTVGTAVKFTGAMIMDTEFSE